MGELVPFLEAYAFHRDKPMTITWFQFNYKLLSLIRFIVQVDKPNDFGNSWVLDPQTCDPDTDPIDPCVIDSPEYQQAQDLCYVLIVANGPFKECYDLVDPTPYHEACVYDLCATLPEDDVLCDSLAEYAQACRNADGSPGDWRAETSQCGE